MNISGLAGGVATRNLVQSSAIRGAPVGDSGPCELSLNSAGFNEVGIDVKLGGGCVITRNNVSRSSAIDCRWDGTGTRRFLDNVCRSEIPPGAWD